MSVRVLLVDDHLMFRQGLATLLGQEPEIEVVGEAGDGMQAVAMTEKLHPDVIVMDISMSGIDGVETTRRLLAQHPECNVVALSAYVYKRYVLSMLDAGARAYVTKVAAGRELADAVLKVAHGKTYFCAEAATVLADAARRPENRNAGSAGKTALARREREVLALIAEGRSSAEIAKALFIAPGTVAVHRRNLMRKLDLHTVAELTQYAIREGLIAS